VAKPSEGFTYLEELQENYFAVVGETPNPELPSDSEIEESLKATDDEVAMAAGLSDHDRERVRTKMRAEIARWSAAGRTRFESPVTHGILVRLWDWIEGTGHVLPLASRPTLGTLPISQLNAYTLLVPGTVDQYVVAFQRGVFSFLNLLCKSIISSFPLHQDGEEVMFSSAGALLTLRENPRPSVRFQYFLDAYVLDGDTYVEQYVLPQPWMMTNMKLVDAAQLFLVAHEYAHLYLGHLHETSRDVLQGEVPVEVLSRSMQQELEADSLGLQMMLATMVVRWGVDPSFAFAGADVLFHAMSIMDRAIGILVGRPDEAQATDGSHPPIEMRREWIRGVYMRNGWAERGGPPLRFALPIAQVVELYWLAAEPHFRDLRARSVPPNEVWR
jgi:hypothetical protein